MGIRQILPSICERARDTAISLRIETANIISKYLERERDINALRTWIEAIAATSMSDEKVDENAFCLFERYVINPRLIEPLHEAFSLSLEVVIGNFLSRFAVNHSVTPIWRQVSEALQDDSPQELWMLARILSSIDPKGIPSEAIIDMWPDRHYLPYYFLEVVSSLKKIPIEFFDNVFTDLENTNRPYSTLKGLTKLAIMSSKKMQLRNLCKIAKAQIKEYILTSTDVNVDKEIYILGEISAVITQMAKGSIKLLIKLNGDEYPTHVRTASILALTKAVVSSREAAFDIVKSVGELINDKENPLVVMNAICSISDICICHTSIGKLYLPAVLRSIISPNPRIQRHSLVIITKLLSEEYLRMKPLYFFVLMLAVSDPNAGVAEIAEACLFGVVMRGSSRAYLISDAVFFFAGCNDKLGIPNYTDFMIKDYERRRRMYRITVDHLSEVEVAELVMGINGRVIDEIVDGKIKPDSHYDLIHDSIVVLSLLQEKIRFDATGKETQDQNSLSLIRTKLARRVLPAVMKAREVLRKANSDLQDDIGKLIAAIVENNPVLINDVRAFDPLLYREIELAVTISHQTDVANENISRRRRTFGSRLLRNLQRRSIIIDSANILEPTQKMPPGTDNDDC